MLIGDTTGDKTVNNSDVTQTRGQVAIAVSASNFREDVNIDGTITSEAVSLVRSDVGHTLPQAFLTPRKRLSRAVAIPVVD
jgi:hypothetical protein